MLGREVYIVPAVEGLGESFYGGIVIKASISLVSIVTSCSRSRTWEYGVDMFRLLRM